ncbi:MAG: SLBB domain-containing protein [Candidatus Margulisiibacteriota bacterium]
MLKLFFVILCSINIYSQLANTGQENLDFSNLTDAQKTMALTMINQGGNAQKENVIQIDNTIETDSEEDEVTILEESESPKLSLIEKQYNEIDIDHQVSLKLNGHNPTITNNIYYKIQQQVKTKNKNLLFQYGYNIFDTASYQKVSNEVMVPNNYRLQKGDRFTLLIYGKKEQVFDLLIDNDGEVFIPNIGPIAISGLSISEANKKIRLKLSQKYVNFKSQLKLSTMKDVVIFISGNVNQPGTYSVSKFESIFSVLSKANGIGKSGSLRMIKLLSSNGRKKNIDLYDYLLNFNTKKVVSFNEGDVLYVPSIGNTVAIAGEINSPGIYEIKSKDTVSDVIRYASGVGLNAYLSSIYINRFDNQFQRKILSVQAKSSNELNEKLKKERVKNGDVIFLNKKSNTSYGYVNIIGNVNVPGKFQFEDNMNLGELISLAKGLKLDSFENVHVFRYQSEDRRQLLNISILNSKFKLENRDVVTIYNKIDQSEKRKISIIGEVQSPGDFNYFEGMTVADALIIAKPREFASLYKVEVARFSDKKSRIIYVNNESFQSFELKSGDKISVKKDNLRDQTSKIELRGEFVFPGIYIVNKGTKLSEIIKKAGGYTESAYLEGAIFSRKSVQVADQSGQNKVIEDEKRRFIYDQTHLGSLSIDSQVSLGVMMTARKEALTLLEKSSEASSGRVIIDLYKDNFENSNDNFSIQDGDILEIPTKPESVHLIGGVQQGISIAYNSEYSTNDYIQNVGGFTKYADKGNIYIFKTSGRVFQNSSKIEPGDIIYVPEKVNVSFNWLQFLTNITQILSNAVTSLALVKSLQ